MLVKNVSDEGYKAEFAIDGLEGENNAEAETRK